MPIPRASRALERFTVLDLTQVRSGPTCVRQLADWGANVIKIEQPPELVAPAKPPGGPREGPDFQNLHRNKRSMTLNLKSKEGLAAFNRMVKKADVVVENFRPDVKKRLGIDYKALSKVNPKIILGSISGFGQDGPYAGRPGFDQIAQGMGGLMSITGLPGQGPVRVGIPIADLCAGLFCALGIMVALLEREKSKQGQHITTSLLQAQIFMLDFQAARWLVKGEVPKQAGNNHPTSIPTGVFKTSDGHINIASTGQKIWERFCQALGQPESDQASRIRHRGGALEEPRRAQRRDRRAHGQAHQRRLGRALQQGRRALRADLRHRPGVWRPAGRAPQDGAAGQEEGQGDEARRPADVAVAHAEQARGAGRPELGEHTDQVLKEFGFKAERDRSLAQGQRDLRDHSERARETDMDDVTKTDKMLSRKDGSVGYVIFNNPERHNAVSLDMWARTAEILDDFAQRRRGARGGDHRRRRQVVRVGRRHLEVRERARLAGGHQDLQRRPSPRRTRASTSSPSRRSR